MNDTNSRGYDTYQRKKFGQLLLEAGLINQAQLDIALRDQKQFIKLRVGEILTLRGWLKSQTADFLLDLENQKEANVYQKKHPIGFYFEKAGLLTQHQVEKVLEEQETSGVKFCQTAIDKGFLKEETAYFFLNKIGEENVNVNNDRNLYAKKLNSREIDKITGTERITDTACAISDEDEILVLEHDTNDIIITPEEIIFLSEDDEKCFYFADIAYSPICIDF